MKAISLRQPWADLVVTGRKTLELRSWTVSHRGLLAIHASQTVNEEACHRLGVDPRTVTTGALVGIVELTDIIPIDEQAYADYRDEHLAGDFFSPPLFGWKLIKPKVIDPIPFTGRMGLFNIPDEVFTHSSPAPSKSIIQQKPSVPLPDLNDEYAHAAHPFELRVIPETAESLPSTIHQTSYRLGLFQRVVQASPAQKTLLETTPAKMRPVAELSGSLLRAVSDVVLETLRQNGYSATDLGTGRREPFRLDEESGVRLGLIFLAVRPITKLTRVEDISHGIRAMTREELYYWFSKCTGPAAERTQEALRAQKALRNLLADE